MYLAGKGFLQWNYESFPVQWCCRPIVLPGGHLADAYAKYNG
jgi:hypothetical protein